MPANASAVGSTPSAAAAAPGDPVCLLRRESTGAAATLHDGPVEQPGGFRCGEQGAYQGRAGGLAADRHVGGVTTEIADRAPYPVQGGQHVEQAAVARCPSGYRETRRCPSGS